MALATLSIDIEAKLAKLEEGMSKATRVAERNAAQMSAAFDRVGATLSAISAAAAPLLAGITVTGLVRSSAQAVDALNDVADATGSSIEKLSGLEEVAMRNGGTLDDVASILVKFNGALKEADGKNGVSQALKAIGLEAAELRKLDPSEALQRTAQALAAYADDGDKARLVQELFGKSIREAAPFLKDLAEAGELNVRVTKEQAEQAEKFNKALAALATQASQAGRSLIVDLLPGITSVLEAFNKGGASGAANSLLERIGIDDQFGSKLTQAKTSLELLGIALQRVRLEGVLKVDPANAGALREMEALEVRARQVGKAFTDARAAYLNLNSAAGAGRGFVNPEVVKPGLGAFGGGGGGGSGGAASVSNEVDRYIKSLEDATLRELDLGEAGKVAFREIELRAKGATAAQLAYIKTLADGLDKLRAKGTSYDDLPESALTDFVGQLDDQRLQKLLAQTASQQAAGRQFQMGEVFNALKAGKLGDVSVDAMGEIIDVSDEAKQRFIELSAVVLDLGDQAQPAFDRIAAAADQLRDTLGEAIGSGLYEALGGDFDNIERAWGNLLKRMLADALAVDLKNALFGQSNAGGLGDLLGGLGKVFGGFFAEGGTLGAGQWGIAGEAGPEIIHGPATITPMAKVGGGSLTQVFHIGQGVTPAQLAAAMAAAREQGAALGYARVQQRTARGLA